MPGPVFQTCELLQQRQEQLLCGECGSDLAPYQCQNQLGGKEAVSLSNLSLGKATLCPTEKGTTFRYYIF